MFEELYNALPVKVNLRHRGVMVDCACSLSGKHPEKIDHVFWYCQFSKKVWKRQELWYSLNFFPLGSFLDLFTWIVENGRERNL